MRLHLEGGKYRSLQAGNPRNVKTTAIYLKDARVAYSESMTLTLQ
jgi:hypothetical protein